MTNLILGLVVSSLGLFNLGIGIGLMGDRNVRALIHVASGLLMMVLGGVMIDSPMTMPIPR